MQTEEITDIALSEDQEKEQVETIVSASLANIQSNREILEGVAKQYSGIKINGIDDKANYKTVSAGITATRSGRTTVAKLVKSGKSLLDKAKKRLDEEGEQLIAIVSPVELELKAEKERIDNLKLEAEQEELRKAEEKKQSRIAKLFELGLTFNGSYYSIGELSITPIQIVQYTEAQWEGFVAQATIEYEAVQLKIAEEEEQRRLNEQKLAEENQKQQAELERQRLENQRLQEQQNLLQQEILAERQETRVREIKSKDFVLVELRNCYEYRDFVISNAFILESTKAQWEEKIAAFEAYLEGLKKPNEPIVVQMNSVVPEKLTPQETETMLDDVFGVEEPKVPEQSYTSQLTFTSTNPFKDVMVGKTTFRIYPELFVEEANSGLTKEMVAATGEFSDDLLFIVIKPQ